MTPLLIDTRGGDWQAIVRYAELRRAELLEDMDNLQASEQARRDAAVRRDELAILLLAPHETVENTAREASSAENTMRTY